MAGSRAMQEQLPSVVGYIVYFSNILLFLITIIVLGEICSVPMKYPGKYRFICLDQQHLLCDEPVGFSQGFSFAWDNSTPS